MESALNRFRHQLTEQKLEWFIVLQEPYVRYLTGYTGSNGLCCITPDTQWFLTDFRYQQQVTQEVSGCSIHIGNTDLVQELMSLRIIPEDVRVGLDTEGVLYTQMQALEKGGLQGRLQCVTSLLSSLAERKSTEEIEKLQKAADITDRAFGAIVKLLKPGIIERDIAAELSFRMRQYGSEKDSFDAIIASGARSVLPHGLASNKVLEPGELVVMDFGGVYQGYHADITRTVMIGEPSARQREIYEVVFAAQQLARESARAGMTCSALDAIARREITERGYGEYFGHGLGHGIGLRIHENPRLNRTSESVLMTGHVVTIEPGVYLPGVGGVRIEDDVVIENGGIRELTHSPREMMIIQ